MAQAARQASALLVTAGDRGGGSGASVCVPGVGVYGHQVSRDDAVAGDAGDSRHDLCRDVGDVVGDRPMACTAKPRKSGSPAARLLNAL